MHDKHGSKVWWSVPHRDVDEPRQPWVRMMMPVVCQTDSSDTSERRSSLADIPRHGFVPTGRIPQPSFNQSRKEIA